MSGCVIILDGPDCAGKTTLANEIVKQTGGKYYHLTYVKGNREMWTQQARVMYAAEILAAQGKTVVIDRNWISECIYSRVYRGGSEMPWMGRNLDRWCLRLGALYVLCHSDSAGEAMRWHKDALSERPEMYESDKRIGQVAELYREGITGRNDAFPACDYWEELCGFESPGKSLVNWLSDWVPYHRDRGGKDLVEFAKNVIGIAEDRRRSNYQACRDDRTLNAAGHIGSAKVLMVGDTTNVNKVKRDWMPFIGLGGSSEFLASCLSEVRLAERDLFWTNAWPTRPDGILIDLLTTFKWSAVVCLGEEAKRGCGAYATHLLPHPSWARRFNKRKDLVDGLRKIKEFLDLQRELSMQQPKETKCDME